MNCSKHHDQELSWVCLEKKCEQRVMCSRCAVKTHPKDHKLEELTTVVQTGIMAAYQNNPINNTYGVHRLCTQIESTIGSQPSINVSEIISLVETNLRAVSDAIKNMRQQLVQQTLDIYHQEENQRIQVHEQLKEYEFQLATGNFHDSKQLATLLDEAFNSINQYADQKEYELQNQHNSDLTIYQKKQ